MSRRPSVSIYNYPEDLNPFNDGSTTETASTTTNNTKQSNAAVKNSVKEPKHKFWTFGRSKKKQRSNSFSIKSTWNGLFGKRKDSQEVEIRKPTIATVSSTYKRGTYNGYPVAPPRLSKDQQEFEEAFGTLARRRKYTLDNSSRYSSTLTVNGDPGRIYEGSPQDTTASIMGDLTPKAPARRFGQVSPKPTDKIPPLDYCGKERTSNGNVVLDEREPNRTPVPPKRGGPRSSQRSLAPVFSNDNVSTRSNDVSMRDENENVPEDYVFKRFNQDAIRKSNLSINSCVSIGSTVSAYGRKKRRAPQPPRIKEPLETPRENVASRSEIDESKTELQIVESIDIARVTENIDEMTKRSRELDETLLPSCSPRSNNEVSLARINNDICSTRSNNDADEILTNTNNNEAISTTYITTNDTTRTINEENVLKLRKNSKEYETMMRENEKVEEASRSVTTDELCTNLTDQITKISETRENDDDKSKNDEIMDDVEVELRRKNNDTKFEMTKDCECYASMEDLPLKRRKSSGNLSRSDSFSVKEEIEKIERQIKRLEAINPRESSNEDVNQIYERAGTRLSLRETRKNFFRNMADDERVKVELRELPREQNDIRIVRIDEPPISIDGPTEPVKIIELHISEPIKQKPAIIIDRDVNPIPKPRRHSNFDLEGKETRPKVKHEKEDDEKRGNSL